MQAFELYELVLDLDLLDGTRVVDLTLGSLHLDELFGVGVNSRLFSVSKSFQEGIWLQAVEQVLDVLISELISSEDFNVELSNLILDCGWNSLGSLCLYTLSNLNYE